MRPRKINKVALRAAILAALRAEFDTIHTTSQKTRAAGGDPESKAEGKYDTRSTEDNYLADGLARKAFATSQVITAYENLTFSSFAPGTPIAMGALVQLAYSDETPWFLLGPAAGGLEVRCEGTAVTILTPESRLGSQLIGLKVGDALKSPAAKIWSIE